MAEAVWWVLQQMGRLKEKRKLFLIISDGDPDDSEAARNALRACEAQGLEVYGIGIQTPAMQRLLPEKRTQVIYDLNCLAPAMFDLLRDSLLKNIIEGGYKWWQ